jgi:two-component system chemotaxis sensor kinase CheA
VDELLGEFIAETLETLEALSSEVVAWENDPADHDRLGAFFRFFHTVKGSCGFLNLPRFERLSHAAEDVLAAIRAGERAPDAATITAVLAIMDRIGDLAKALAKDGEAPDESGDDLLIARLAAGPAAPNAQETATGNAAVPPNQKADASPTATEPRERGPRTIRISLSVIDQLMNGVSDMVLARNEMARKLRDSAVGPEIDGSFERLSACIADMRDLVSRSRMQRVDRLFAAIPRMVRDLGQELGKKVELALEGGDVEMDREMIEMVLDPLTHLVRNALDHGLERPAERIAAGKPEIGRMRIAARQSGNQIVIEIADNGRGIDADALVGKALRLGVIKEHEAASMSMADKINLVFHAGLSTAKQVSAISGRGVGMDVVRNNVERIGGIVTLESAFGRGTKIRLRVPMTLTIIPGLILRCGSDLFAIPRGNVIELIFESSDMVGVETVGGAQIATIRGERHSLVDLAELVGQTRDTERRGKPRSTLMLINSPNGKPYALRVDAVENNEELVIRPASPQIMSAGIFAGMTLPDTGRPMLLLDPAGIAQVAEVPIWAVDPTAGKLTGAVLPTAAAETIQALHFVETTGQHRLIALNIVDRIEDIPADRFGTTTHEHFVRLNDRLVRVANAVGPSGGLIKTLHLHAGDREICYVVRDVIDIVDMPICPELPLNREGLSGIVAIEGKAFEVIDTHALFAAIENHQATATGSPRGTCLVDGIAEDSWMRTILAPLLIQAGYEVLDAAAPAAADGPGPYVLLCDAEKTDRKPPVASKVPVIRLCAHPADEQGNAAPSIYRYDRPALLAAIESQLQGQAA